MMEGEYLELCNDLKSKYDTITDKLDKIELQELQLKKDFISCYGIVRMLDNLISNSHIGYDNEVVTIVEVLRGMVSNMMDTHIFGIEDAN